MTTTTMRRLVPSELIAPLKILGQYNWLQLTPADTSPPSTRLEVRIPPGPALAQLRRLIARLELGDDGRSVMLCQLYVLSKALAEGPKLLRPTAEQCEALEHVDVNVSFDDYEQPFSTFLLELPGEFRRRLAERFGCDCPDFVVTHHDRLSKYIVSSCERAGSGSLNIMSPRPDRDTIEAALRFSVDQGKDLDQAELIQRIAVNFGLLMARYGVRDAGPVDPAAHAKQLRNARRSNRVKAERARALLDAGINLIEFEQEVVLCDRSQAPRPDDEGDGGPRRPHWRRGHFRRQPFGQARSERKLVFIRPVLVNAAQFHGDIADTEYRIRAGTQASLVS
jgi:hypothetical protein